MSAATILKHAATVLQALTLVGFILVLFSNAIHLTRPEHWLGILCFFLLPVLAQVLICWFLRHPIIHVSSVIASFLILLFQASDLFARGYVPAVILTLPATVIVLFLGTVVFFVHHRLTRPSKRSRRAHSQSGMGVKPSGQSDGSPR